MKVTLQDVSAEDKETLNNLVEFYLYEMSTIFPVELDEHGRYNYEQFASYFTGENRFAFFIMAGNNLAGFVLVNDYYYMTEGAKSIAEFFVLKKYRRQGIGTEAARQIFTKFPGAWEVGQLTNNTAAQAFWRTVIHKHTKGAFTEKQMDNDRWHGPVQQFVI